MLIENINEIESKNYQVVIIGSGPAGISVALSLEKKNINCIIIEAGEKNFNESSQEFYKGKVIGDISDDISVTRLRQLGGTSGHWGGWCRPLESYDFNTWSIKKKEIDFFLNETCSILGIENEFSNFKIDKNFNQINFQGSSVDFANKYFEYIKKSSKIDLVLNTQFSIFNGGNGIINSALVTSNNIQRNIYSKFFVLACGGIENSRLLLWNKIKNPNLLINDLPIGNYWMTHPWTAVGYGLVYKQKVLKISKFNKNNDRIIHFATSNRFSSSNLSGNIFLAPFEDQEIYKKFIKDIVCFAPEYGKKIIKLILNKNLVCGNIFLHLQDKKEFNNKILLSDIKDSFGIPRCIVKYRFKNEVIKSAKNIAESFAQTCINNDLGRISIKNEIINLSKFDNLGVNHHIGGTIMGSDYKNSVVDKNLKIHGMKNIYIAGSSVFPSTGYANPTFTIVQLSLRLANEIYKNIYNT